MTMASEVFNCPTGKICLSGKEAIEKIASLSRRKKKHKFSTYKCHICGNIHITTATKSLRPTDTKQKHKNKFKANHYEPIPSNNPKPRKTKPVSAKYIHLVTPAKNPIISAQTAALLKQIIAANGGG